MVILENLPAEIKDSIFSPLPQMTLIILIRISPRISEAVAIDFYRHPKSRAYGLEQFATTVSHSRFYAAMVRSSVLLDSSEMESYTNRYAG